MNTNFKARCLFAGQAAMVLVACVAPAPRLFAGESAESEYMGEAPDRYAQVKALEGDVRIHRGDGEEALTRTMPVAEGDVLESRGRGVLQLGDGSRIAFAENTRVQIAALFTNKDGGREVLLRLDQGRIRLQVASEGKAEVRVDTPSGTGRLESKGLAEMEVAEDHTVRVRVSTGHMTFTNESDRTSLNGGERLTVYSAHDQLDRIRSFNTYDNDSFDAWTDRYFNVKHGESYARVPSEIRNFADELDGHGEWVYVEEYNSWCWRPLGLAEDWRPYGEGRWVSYPGGMTWVDAAPWGFVTCHYGRWGWRTGFGWCWIPGVYYAPAWVAWHSMDGYIGWAPLGFYNDPCYWGYPGWGHGYCWNVVSCNNFTVVNVNRCITRDVTVIHRFYPTPVHPIPGAWPVRPLTPAWRPGPLILNREELRNPVRIHDVVQNRTLVDTRLRDYERVAMNQTGRQVFQRQDALMRPGLPTPSGMSGGFEDRARLRQDWNRPTSAVSGDRRPESVPPRPVDRPNSDAGRPQPRPDSKPEVRQTSNPGPRYDPRRDYRSDTPSRDNRSDGFRERPRTEDRPVISREQPRDDQRRGGNRMEVRPSGHSEPARSAPPSRQEPQRSEPSRSSSSESSKSHPTAEKRR